MRNRLLFVVVLMVAIVAAGVLVSGADSDRKTMKRTEDQIVLAGKQLQPALGWPIGQVRAFAFMQGNAKAVPFQIDEKKKDGFYALAQGQNKSTEDNVYDDNDELVFMIMDTGDKGAKAQLPGAPDAAVEIEIADPVDGGKSWLYLARYPQNAPALSAVDYVRFDNARSFIDTQRFEMGFHPKASLSIGHLALKKEGGGTGADMVDRLKVRFTAKTLGGAVTLDKNEEQFVSKTMGWIDGPVRIVRSTANQMMLWKFKTPSAYLNNIYYVNSFEFPTEVNVPFNPGALLTDPRFRVSTDALCNLAGRKFFNSNNPGGVLIDGVMSEAEKNMNRNPYKWSAVTLPTGGAWINRLMYDAAAAKAVPMLYYNDNRAVPDPPEDEPGECGDIGYVLVGLDKVTKGVMRLVSVMYNCPNYSADKIPAYMRILDNKLKVAARAL